MARISKREVGHGPSPTCCEGGPKRERDSLELMNALTISASTQLPLKALSMSESVPRAVENGLCNDRLLAFATFHRLAACGTWGYGPKRCRYSVVSAPR